MNFGDYLANVGGALSMLVNALIGGEYGETLSSRIGRSWAHAAADAGMAAGAFREGCGSGVRRAGRYSAAIYQLAGCFPAQPGNTPAW